MKNKLAIVLIILVAFLSGCNNTANKSSTSTNTSSTPNSTVSSNNKVNVTIGDNTNATNTTPPIKNVAPTNVPPVSPSTAGSKNTVNPITAQLSTDKPAQIPATNVTDEVSFRKALTDNLSQGKDFAVNLQGSFTKDNISEKAMKIIETSGYSGYVSGIKYSVYNNVAYIYFQYKDGNAKFLSKSNAVDAKVKEIVSKVVTSSMSDYDKELALHDYLVNNTSYDYANLIKGTLPGDSFTAYGALISGVAVCEGYAESMYKLLTEAGVQSSIINGFGNGVAHEWNLVKIQGGMYHLDATYDDPVSSTDKILTHNYFNVNDAQISKDHTWENADYPQSVAVAANYFVVNNLVATNKSKYYDIIKNELMKKTPIIDIRTAGYDPSIYTSDVILKVIKDNPTIDYVDSTLGYSFSYDPSSNVIEFIMNYKG